MRASLCGLSIIVVLLVAELSPARQCLCAQEKKDDAKDQRPVVETEAGLNACAMLACYGSVPRNASGPSWGLVMTRMLASQENLPLKEWQFEFREPLPLPRIWLEKTNDNRPLPKILHRELKELGPDLGFYMLLNHALNRVQFSSQEMFETGAEKEEHRVYPDLKATPGRFRGKIITVTGKLELIRKVDTPRLAAEWYGNDLPHIYTAWITGPTKNAPPYAVVFTHLPKEIPKEKEEFKDTEVTFHGYFLALVSFTPDKVGRAKPRDIHSPYLVGKTLIVLPPDEKKVPPAPPEDKVTTPLSASVLVWAMGAIVSVAVFVALLNVWLRRGDRKTQARLMEVRDKHQPFNIEPDTAPAVVEPPPKPEESIEPADRP